MQQNQVVQDQRIDRILSAVREHLGAEIAFVSRYIENDERELTHINTDLPIPHKPGFREPKENGYCWHVAQGTLPELIPDAQQIEFVKDMEITKALPVGCHLNIPLKLSNGQLYGSFCCISREARYDVNDRDMGILKSFATLAVEHIETNLEGDLRRSVLEQTIDDAIKGQVIQILHQPIVSLSEQTPIGVECLARFPDAKSRGPDKWFGEADEVGRGLDLELAAIECALATLDHVPRGVYMSVNASPSTITSGKLAALFAGATPDRLVLEVTEHNAVEDFAELGRALDELRPYVRIAIDDVGAGYAGLRHIVDLKPDILKLDMSLTRDVHLDPARRALAVALVAYAKQIDCSLVAEGIENTEELNVLRKLGVNYGQGYHFSRPLPVIAAQQWLLGLHRKSAPPSSRDQSIQPAQQSSIADVPIRRRTMMN
ncbi:MAG: EAL domain-containing protein [Erythrobacter sp.]